MLVLHLLLACRPTGPTLDAVVGTLPDGARVVDRHDGDLPALILVEVPAGDPRTPDRPPDAALVRAVHAGVTDVVLDTPAWPSPPTPTHRIPAEPDPDLEPLRRFAGLIEPAATPLAGMRDMVMSGGAPRRQWDEVRERALRGFDAFDARAAARGQRLIDAASALDEPALVAVPPMSVPAAMDRARAAGRAAVVLRPADLDDLHDPAVWWGRVRAALPAPASESTPLPPFDPWVDALRPHVAALRDWDEADAVRADIRAAVGPPPAELAPDDPRRAVLTAAARRLHDALEPGLTATALLGDPEATLGTLRVCGRPMPDTPMSYDPLFDVLKVDTWVADLPLDLVAVVLAHELVHVHDLHAAATSLGTDPAGWAFAHDTLPLGVGRGVRLLGEDRAFRVELELVAAMRVPLPDVDQAQRDIGSDAPSTARLPATLRLLGAEPPGSVPWMTMLSDLIAPRG